MIQRSRQFDLGQDTTRMKDARDAERQHATVDHILSSFFRKRGSERWEAQILADEVGMGKTFVALAVAYSILQALREGKRERDLEKCYQKVLVVVPNNKALFNKWHREVAEFVKRCVKEQYRREAERFFSPCSVSRIDELAAALRRSGAAPRMVITKMAAMGRSKIRHNDVKTRHLLWLLFKYWGNKFTKKRRTRLLKGAGQWPSDPRRLVDFESEAEKLLFADDEVLSALTTIARRERKAGPGQERLLQALLDSCRELAEMYARYREERFAEVKRLLGRLYKKVAVTLIRRDLPLVVVDEAHNWKNHRNGYPEFTETIGPHTRRLLMLTATPFQLHPEEMLQVLQVVDHIAPAPRKDRSLSRRKKLKNHRQEVIRPVLRRARRASERFTEAWRRLPLNIKPAELNDSWEKMATTHARLRELAALPGVVEQGQMEQVIAGAVQDTDPSYRQLLAEALRLYCYNFDLSCELGKFVIRHRRKVEHRLFKVGQEFVTECKQAANRPDRHLLHKSPGMDVRGEAELPHYLLMRCVSEMKKRGRTSLGTAITGCYSTLLESQEGKEIKKYLRNNPVSSAYFDLLLGMVGRKNDPRHPKVENVVTAVTRAWEQGEKSLIFCFRTNTARRLQEIIASSIGQKLAERRTRCLGGGNSLLNLRKRLTNREDDLITIALDRVLWSRLLATARRRIPSCLAPEDLQLQRKDLYELARLSLAFDVAITGKRIDRVFLLRACEHVMARRLLAEKHLDAEWQSLLAWLADEDWLTGPYGLRARAERDDGGEEEPQFDERGANTSYRSRYLPADADTRLLARQAEERITNARSKGQIPILDFYAHSPSLWLGTEPRKTYDRLLRGKAGRAENTMAEIHAALSALTFTGDEPDWESRRKILQAMRRAVLRESVLLRLLPDRQERETANWGQLLVKEFLSPMPGQQESFADRIRVFLEDLLACSGSIGEASSARHALYEATRLSDQRFVALVQGKTKDRDRIFSGFNSPLLPEVLVCTSVGQEGIDLHRHCRNVIHYDLAWNPAVIEQRTGRVDRIGSKTQRERKLAGSGGNIFLEIGVPYLAGTYDERMYEELRLRAQTFEVLTGGRLVVDGDTDRDNPEGRDDTGDAEGVEMQIDLLPLPERMVDDLRVKLGVWPGHLP